MEREELRRRRIRRGEAEGEAEGEGEEDAAARTAGRRGDGPGDAAAGRTGEPPARRQRLQQQKPQQQLRARQRPVQRLQPLRQPVPQRLQRRQHNRERHRYRGEKRSVLLCAKFSASVRTDCCRRVSFQILSPKVDVNPSATIGFGRICGITALLAYLTAVFTYCAVFFALFLSAFCCCIFVVIIVLACSGLHMYGIYVDKQKKNMKEEHVAKLTNMSACRVSYVFMLICTSTCYIPASCNEVIVFGRFYG